MYLDNNVAAKPSSKVIEAMRDSLDCSERISNDCMEYSYNALYDFIGADNGDNIIITSSGEEAVSQAIMSAYYEVASYSERNHFILLDNSESAAINTTRFLSSLGCSVSALKLKKDGKLDLKLLYEELSPKVLMLSLSWADGMTGIIQDIVEISEICYNKGVLLHVDATHVVGKLEIDLHDSKIDYLSFNGAQFGAPQGTGVLYAKRGAPLKPLINGGLEQGSLRGGCLASYQLAGLVSAVNIAKEEICQYAIKMVDSKHYFESLLKDKISDVEVVFSDGDRLPNTSCIIFKGIYNENLLYFLNKANVYASCGGGNFQSLTDLLLNYGYTKSDARSAISFALPIDITEDDIVELVTVIADEVERVSCFNMMLTEMKR